MLIVEINNFSYSLLNFEVMLVREVLRISVSLLDSVNCILINATVQVVTD